MSELWQLSALELAGKIRTGKAASREVMQAHIDLSCLAVAAEIESLIGTITPIDPVTA